MQAAAALRQLDPASAADLVDSIALEARGPPRDFQLLIARLMADVHPRRADGIKPGTPMLRIGYVPTGMLDLDALEAPIAGIRGGPRGRD